MAEDEDAFPQGREGGGEALGSCHGGISEEEGRESGKWGIGDKESRLKQDKGAYSEWGKKKREAKRIIVIKCVPRA
jgi:hypothetical protein